MVRKIREYWFGILLLTISTLFLLFVSVVASAPHNDEKMRGFTPCTYKLAEGLSAQSGQSKIWGVFGVINDCYWCYAMVMWQGVELWSKGKQQTPWSNYIFEPYTMEVPKELSEPLSDDLLKANRLDDDNEESMWIVTEGE